MEKSKTFLVIEKVAQIIHHKFNPFEFQKKQSFNLKDEKDILSFINQLTEEGNKIQLMLMQHYASAKSLINIVNKFDFPVIAFKQKEEGGEIIPVIILKKRKRLITFTLDKDDFDVNYFENDLLEELVTKAQLGEKYSNQIVFLVPSSINSLISPNLSKDDYADDKEFTPLRRLWRLLSTERREIGFIYVYAVTIGIISLSLPLGIQAIINLISSGMIFSSVILLIVGVIAGIIVGGVLQILQVSMVEILQRRIFAKGSFEFAYRIPKFRAESITKDYPPELVNRFFDILTIQKGLPKLLIEISAALLQIFFGVILLSFYHPFFVFFGFFLLLAIYVLFYVTGEKGLKTSIYESKYKYKIAHWLQEIGRTIIPFKMAGFTNLPLQKTDYLLNNYLKSRKAHFKVLISQYSFVIGFKTLITAGVLIMGTVLVTDKQITLGQFVASEIVIILIIGAVEKFIVSMDVIYDLLTALDKVGHITDIPLEKEQGAILKRTDDEKGMDLNLINVQYKYPESDKYTLKEITFKVEAGQHVGIAGESNSGKNTLAQIISGVMHDYEGIITLDGLSLRDLDVNSIRDNVGVYFSESDVFDGTIYENISMGIQRTTIDDVMKAIEAVGLSKEVNALKDGLNTHIPAYGKGFSATTIKKIALARAVAEKPRLLIINDFLQGFSKHDALKILNFLFDKANKWTMICISNDPMILSFCDKVVVLENGYMAAEDSFDNLMKINWFNHKMDN
ncbi:MAG: ATP-binding cassette domain-containing protein [Cytophagales bacterium]